MFHSRIARVGVLFAFILTAFYQVENWRGKRAWRLYKAEQERKGVVMDWQDLVPPPVPDELNAYKAPMVTEIFATLRNSAHRPRFTTEEAFSSPPPQTGVLAEITILPVDAPMRTSEPDLVLAYQHPVVFVPAEENNGVQPPGTTTIPLVVMDGVPLLDAIKSLARQADLNYMLDPSISHALPQPEVSLRMGNVTALQLLTSLLHSHGLELVDDLQSRICRIQHKTQERPRLHFVGDTGQLLREILASQPPPKPPGPGVQKLRAATGDFVLFWGTPEHPTASPSPAHIAVRSSGPVSEADLQELIKATGAFTLRDRITVAASGTNSFAVFKVPVPYCSAADYLARTDPLQKQLEPLRAALKRPMVRMDGAEKCPFDLPAPNFFSFRTIGQMLAQRAQAHLLMDQPAEALREIRLIHDMCALLENRPSGKPVTLVSAMIRVALTGVYTRTVAEGFELARWREPQLRELQEMLASVRLLPAVDGALTAERVAMLQSLQTMSADQFVRAYSGKIEEPTTAEKLKSPVYWLLLLAPRGWVYQNALTMAQLRETSSNPYDPVADTLAPNETDPRVDEQLKKLNRFSPYNLLVILAVPNFVRAWETTARNQALVAEAYVAAGLERYRIARGTYPEQLQELVPDYANHLPRDIMTGDLLKYARIGPGEFRLYSVGWNCRDDGGLVDATPGAHRENGDWTWPRPSRKGSSVAAR
jgi:hypothetical protein